VVCARIILDERLVGGHKSAPDMARQQGHRSDRDQSNAAGAGRYKGGETALPDLTACSQIYFVGI
jgi:hypothetical protein